METSGTSVSTSAKRRSQSVDSALAVIRDLLALQTRGLTASLTRTVAERGLEDSDVLQNQQLYCRYASDNSSNPVRSWKSRSQSASQTCFPEQCSKQHAQNHAAQPTAVRLSSPFQAMSALGMPETPKGQKSQAAAHGSPLSWPHTGPSLSHELDMPANLNSEDCLDNPQMSVLSTTAETIPDASRAQIDRHLSVPISPMSPDPLSMLLDPAHSLASDTVSFHTSPSLPVLDLPAASDGTTASLDAAAQPSEVRLQLVSAPAAFGQPIGINKAISPPLQARVQVASAVPTQLHVKLVAYLITSEQLLNLSKWDPNAHVVSEHIIGGVAEQNVLCETAQAVLPGGRTMYKGSYNLSFRDMKFATASRMRPRWLVLAMMVGDDALFLHYKVPTIVMSRSCDQNNKAAGILRGELQHKKRPRSSEPDDGQMSQCHLQQVTGSKPAVGTACSPPAGVRVVTQGLLQPALSAEPAVSLGRSMSFRSDATLRTYDSGLRQPRQTQPFSARESAEPHGLLSPSDHLSISQSIRSSSMPNHAYDSDKLTPISKLRAVSHIESDPRLCDQDPKSMLATFLSHDSAVPASPLLPAFEPLSPTSSAMLATLLIPASPMAGNDASAFFPDSPVAGKLDSGLNPFLQGQHSPDSGQSNRSSDTRTASQSPGIADPHWAHPESSWAQPHQAASNDAGFWNPHMTPLSGTPGMAGRPELNTLSSALMTQDSGLTTPPQPQPKRLTDPRLRASSSAIRSLNSSLQLSEREGLSWPTQGPYNIERWQAVLMQLYRASNLGRPLTNQDVWVLGQVAGFHSDPILLDTDCLSEQQWQDFGEWFISQLRLLRCHQQLWDRRDPVLLCSFEVDRVQCEHLLYGQVPGTFLIRPSISLTGCMVVSLVTETGAVKHLCLDSKQLYARSLEAWVRGAVEAQFLLDYRTGRVWQKDQVFLMQLRRFGATMDLPQAIFPTADCGIHQAVSSARNMSPECQ